MSADHGGLFTVPIDYCSWKSSHTEQQVGGHREENAPALVSLATRRLLVRVAGVVECSVPVFAQEEGATGIEAAAVDRRACVRSLCCILDTHD